MKTLATLMLSAMAFAATAQTTITNGGFENWGNTVPSGDTYTEPTNWYSNQSGSSVAALGGETCFKDGSVFHSGLYSVRVETISGPLSTVINGNVTTGVVNAPSILVSKDSGYIGTVNYSTPSDIRHMSFTGRPDSLVGWYQYTSGGTGEQGKVRAILHVADYYDPEVPTNSYHPDPTANKIADALFLTPMASVATWTRFSVPFTYVSSSSPAYIMINVTSSANQGTTVTGSKLWLDDLEVVYNPTSSTCPAVTGVAASAITGTTATISWSAATGSEGYVWAVNTSAAAPATGTYTTSVTAPVTGLTAGTAYYAHVKDTCGAGNASSWVTTPFTTTGINNIAGSNFGITAYPNPVKDELTVNISGTIITGGQVQLMDISGRVLSSTTANASTLGMSMRGLVSGIYLIRYTDTEHRQTIMINKQ